MMKSEYLDHNNLTIRNYRGPEDHEDMTEIFNETRVEEGYEIPMTVQELESEFDNTDHCNPYEDVFIVEKDEETVGWTQVWWGKDANDVRQYSHSVTIFKEYKSKGGIRELINKNEKRIKEIAEDHPEEGKKVYHIRANEEQELWKKVLESEHYFKHRYGFLMVRPDLDDIPELPLLEGVEIRATKQEHYEKIRKAWNEACKDQRDQVPLSKEDFQLWIDLGLFESSLFTTVWDSDEVIGTCIGIIREDENKENDRMRGYLEFISVKKDWRGRGIAKAMMAETMRKLKDRGMKKAALGVDAENPSGALSLYRKMDFKIDKKVVFYRKEVQS